MHYIRFLKTPRVQVDRGSVLLKAVLAITTDLGETFYPEDVDLVITVRDTENDGDIYLRRKVQWKAGARSVPVTFDLSHQDVEWPACVHVAVKNSNTANICGFLPPICDVWSGLVNPTKGRMDSGRRVERRFLSVAERELSLLEDAGDSIARHLWDGSQALAQHIDNTINMQTPTSLPLLEYVLISATYRKLNVLELGCGCGTVGISLAQAVPDCDVLLTDLPEVTELVTANIDRMKPAIASKVAFDALDWEQPLPKRLQTRMNDLIIVSECTYNTDTLQPLVQTLLNLVARSPKAVLVVSTKTRHESEAAFFDMMKTAGLVEDGSVRLPLPGIPGTGYADCATDVGLYVFHGREHRLSLSPRGSENEVARAQRENPNRHRSG
ncbi:hypothetical protein LTR37_004847 [Vermiconidia calcicola]|uniref:Uncharacterized protein n=1 Tax=Vermiconidia calcicola TaxID=1690605 RepID=A0ACC3NM87_9PEZI|nr:hypothetical protein LTR37_004847 [Vermiconidia calcicola]